MGEVWVAHPTRGASNWLRVTIVIFLAVTCVHSNPTITCPSDKTGNTDSNVNTASVTLTKATVGTNVNVQCDLEGQSTFSIGTTDVTCTATDDDGNTATCVFYVIITDNEDPTINNLPADVRVTIALEDLKFPNARAAATWQAPATNDNSNMLVTLSSTHQSGEMFPIGDTTVTYTAIDKAGNIASESFHVRVLVKPPGDDLSVDGLKIEDNMACLSLVWPETGDQDTESYGLFFWKEGESRPLNEQRKIQTADNSQTYVKYDHCGLLPGELYNVDVQREPAPMMVGSLQFWTMPKKVKILSPDMVNGVAINTSYIDVSWETSSDNADQYTLYISNWPWYREYFTKTTDHTRIEGFRPGSQLDVHLSALVGSGDRRQRGINSTIALQIAQPGVDELIVYNYTESTIAVAWGVADIEQVSSFEPVMVFINPEGTGESFQIITASPSLAEFTGLEPNTNYKIQLIHNLLQVSLTTTQKTRPMRATNVRPTDVQSSFITLEWEPSTTTEGVTYELYISPGEGSDPIAESKTSRTFSQLNNATEYFIKIVSVYDGMKSVPQTLLVTTGVTKPTVPSAFTTVVIVSSVLGCLALVLAVVILIACIKLRRLQQKKPPQHSGQAGHTNTGMNLRETHRKAELEQQQQQDYGSEYAVPGDLGDSTDKTPRRSFAKGNYQNALVINAKNAK